MSNLKDFLGGLDPDVWTDVKAGYLDDNISTKAPASTALSTADWTNTRAGKLDNLDDTVSSRAPSSTALSTATWTGDRAAKLDSIDAAISSRAPSSTALSTATWTNTRAGNLDRLDTTISSRAPSSTALSSNVWTSTRAGYLDTNVSSRAPASTALSNNVWTTTYRNRIDTNISSRLGGALGQQLNSNNLLTSANDYDTWTISTINTGKAFLTNHKAIAMSTTNQSYATVSWGRIINANNVRYGAVTHNVGNTFNAWSTSRSYLTANLNQAYASMLSCMSYS